MSRTVGCTLAAVMVFAIAPIADSKAFLKANSHLGEERMSEEDVQTSLLAEVEGTFGEGSASSRVKQLEAILAPIYAALPKNDKGYLGHATVRYALHRLFVQRHGWFIKGLDAAGGHRNSTSGAGLLKEQVPAYIQDLFEQRLAGRGFGLHELGVLAATIEHLVHSEAIKRLGYAFKVHSLLPTALMSELQADEVLDTYMTAYILGEDLSNMNLTVAVELKDDMPEVYMAWNDTKEFVRATRRNVTESDATAEQKALGGLDFSLVARVAERVGERFGHFQDQECGQIKGDLVKMDGGWTGRVKITDFYKPALAGQWQFQESIPYLRELGALDESDAKMPRVIIANYISSPSNCIASSSFYSVCCMDECEGLLSQLERHVAAPEAPSTRIVELVAQLSSSSVQGPRKLPQVLLDRIGEIAAENGGKVPLHGRLFAQWMHHAFPLECPYPHLSGTTNPQTADEWLESTGQEAVATEEEMLTHFNKTDAGANEFKQEQKYTSELPWSPHEELLVAPQLDVEVTKRSAFSSAFHTATMLVAMASIAYGVSHHLKQSSGMAHGMKAEKYLV